MRKIWDMWYDLSDYHVDWVVWFHVFTMKLPFETVNEVVLKVCDRFLECRRWRGRIGEVVSPQGFLGKRSWRFGGWSSKSRQCKTSLQRLLSPDSAGWENNGVEELLSWYSTPWKSLSCLVGYHWHDAFGIWPRGDSTTGFWNWWKCGIEVPILGGPCLLATRNSSEFCHWLRRCWHFDLQFKEDDQKVCFQFLDLHQNFSSTSLNPRRNISSYHSNELNELRWYPQEGSMLETISISYIGYRTFRNLLAYRLDFPSPRLSFCAVQAMLKPCRMRHIESYSVIFFYILNYYVWLCLSLLLLLLLVLLTSNIVINVFMHIVILIPCIFLILFLWLVVV